MSCSWGFKHTVKPFPGFSARVQTRVTTAATRSSVILESSLVLPSGVTPKPGNHGCALTPWLWLFENVLEMELFLI